MKEVASIFTVPTTKKNPHNAATLSLWKRK
jgi:hypothetical protein